MKRETFKEPEWFESHIQYEEETLNKFEASVAEPDTSEQQRVRLRYVLFKRHLELVIMRYSAGEELARLRAGFPAVVDAAEAYAREPHHERVDFKSIDSYVQSLWLLSLGILFAVDDALFDRILAVNGNRGRDALYDRLAGARRPGPGAAAPLYPKPYQSLVEALDASGASQTKLIEKFLKDYYKGMKNVYWHDSHLGEDAGFFGYWCFELAAAVKLFGIDDAAFAENIFYPRDLVSAF